VDDFSDIFQPGDPLDARGRPRRKPGTWGVIDSIPWLIAACDALQKHSVHAMMVAIYIQTQYAKNDRRPVPVANETLASWGVSRFTKARALAVLEAAGLISVKRVSRRTPVVTVRTVTK
jgi:hypothetical protein